MYSALYNRGHCLHFKHCAYYLSLNTHILLLILFTSLARDFFPLRRLQNQNNNQFNDPSERLALVVSTSTKQDQYRTLFYIFLVTYHIKLISHKFSIINLFISQPAHASLQIIPQAPHCLIRVVMQIYLYLLDYSLCVIKILMCKP